MKKLFSILSVAMFAMFFFVMNTVNASAAEPTTYYVKYDAEKEQWYYQTGSSWDNEVPPPNREVYYMLQEMKDGDYVVVESTDDSGILDIDFHLGNLTVMPNSSAVVTCKSIAECYILHDSTVSIFADVTKAWVYDNVAVNFNKNVNTLELIYEDEPTQSVHVVGTCSDFCASNDTTTKYHLWNFTDELVFNEGIVKTAYGSYSINPPASGSTAPAPTPAAPATTTSGSTTAPSSTSSADEYDDVPKTGESVAYLWMFAIAALCFAGSYSLKKKH